MNTKEIYVLVIFILSFFAFIALTNPSYTGYTTLCSDYTSETSCVNDDSCIWNFDDDTCEDDPLALPENTTDPLSDAIPLEPTDPEAIEILELLGNPSVQAFSLINKITNIPATPVGIITPEMVKEDYSPEELAQISEYQNEAEVRTDIKVFYALDMEGNGLTGTFIQKIATSPKGGYVLEIFNPSIATTEQDLVLTGNYEITSYSPLTISYPIVGTTAAYVYLLPEDISASINAIQTAVIPSSLDEVVPVVQAVCGDGDCTEILEDEITCPEDCARKIPWMLIITLIIILVLAILFFHFFGSKLKGLFKRKEKIFANETDKENLKNYVKHSLEEGLTIEKIRNILLAKDWKPNQIDLVLKELEDEKREKEGSEYKEATPIPEKKESKEEKPEEKEETGGIDDYFESASK